MLSKEGKYVVPLSICFIMIVLLFAVRIADRNRDWRDGLTFWEKTLKTAPQCARVQVNLSEVYVDAGRLDDGLSAAKKALSINPDHIEGRNNLGTIYSRQNMLDEAIAEFKRGPCLTAPLCKGTFKSWPHVTLKRERRIRLSMSMNRHLP